MLGSADRIVLAPGVRLEGVHVVDDVRGARYPANATALALLSGRQPLAWHAASLAARYGMEPDRVRRDVLLFGWSLNRALLANVVPGSRFPRRAFTFAVLALRFLPVGSLPPIAARRHGLDTTTAPRAAATATAALVPRAAAVATVATLAAFHVVALAGSGRGEMVQAVVLGLAAGGALLAHEAAHAVALRGVPAVLVTHRLATFILHGRLDAGRSAFVALAGPAVPALSAAALVTLALARTSLLLALVACPLAGHGLAATVGGRDGRKACGL